MLEATSHHVTQLRSLGSGGILLGHAGNASASATPYRNIGALLTLISIRVLACCVNLMTDDAPASNLVDLPHTSNLRPAAVPPYSTAVRASIDILQKLKKQTDESIGKLHEGRDDYRS